MSEQFTFWEAVLYKTIADAILFSILGLFIWYVIRRRNKKARR